MFVVERAGAGVVVEDERVLNGFEEFWMRTPIDRFTLMVGRVVLVEDVGAVRRKG